MKNIELWLGDCISKMKQIDSESVHCVITDIPYGIGVGGLDWDVLHDNTNNAFQGQSPAQKDKPIFKSRGKPKNGWSEKDKQIPLEFQTFCESFLKEVKRVLYPAGSIIAFTGRQYQHRYMVANENIGLVIKDTLTWDKVNAPFRAQRIGQVIGKRNGDFSDKRRLGNLAPVCEPIVWSFKPYPIGSTITDCYLKYGTGTFSTNKIKNNKITINSKIKDRKHDTEKPQELIDILVETFTKENQTILDPFMGSGTTGKSAKKLGRSFIGIEKERKYYSMAVQKINE